MKFIAETAWHHEGDYIFFKSLIKNLLINSKTDIIKLHITLDLDEYIDSEYNLYNTLEKWLFSENQWTEIISHIIKNDIGILYLTNDIKSVQFVSKFKPKMIEIHSVCLNDIHLLNAINNMYGKDITIFIGVGGSTVEEVKSTINYLVSDNIVLMHGFQNYPTNYKDINFKKIQKLIETFSQFKHGYADHTSWNEPQNQLITLVGGTLGMEFIEKHVTIQYGEKRCDWNSAISIELFNKLIESWDKIEKCFGNGSLNLNTAEQKYSIFGPMKKAAFTSKEINPGNILTENSIYFKRTNQISDLSQLDILRYIGTKINRKIPKDTLLISKYFKK